MQWIPAYYSSLTTVNQTVTNITRAMLRAYEHTNAHTDNAHVHSWVYTQPSTHKPHKQSVRHLAKRKRKKALSVD